MDPHRAANPAPSSGLRSWLTFPITVDRTLLEGIQVQVAWGRLLVLIVVVAVASWMAAAGGAFLWVKYGRDVATVSFTDILFPQRWHDYRVKRGDHYIELAKGEIKAAKWAEAILHLRVGVGLSPANFDGRLLLTQFFAVWGRPELAKRTLIAGFPFFRNDPNFLKPLFSYLLQIQEDDEVQRIATEMLPARPEINDRNQIVAVAAANARYFRGNYDGAEDLIAAYQLLRTRDGRILQARIEWDRGFTELAMIRVRSCIREFPYEDEFHALLCSFYRALGRFDDLERYAVLRQLANPRNPAPRIDLLYVYQRAGDTAKLRREIDTIFSDFPDDRAGLLALGNFAASIGDVALARRVHDHCLDHHLGVEEATTMQIEALVVAGDYRAALDQVDVSMRSNSEWTKRFVAVCSGLQAIASYGLTRRPEGDLYLNRYLGSPNLRAENLLAISIRLLAIGARAEARRVLAQAVATDPKNQAVVTKIIELDLESGRMDDLPVNLRKLLTLRRPSIALLRQAYIRLGSDRCLFLADRDEILATLSSMLEVAPISSPAT